MKKIRLLSVAFVMLSLYALPSLGVVLDVRGGILHGATGITVGSNMYDISFQEGTCIGLFGNCDEISDFLFDDVDSVVEANEELLSQVFVDGAEGMFDTVPSLTFGCERAGNQCGVQTPLGTQPPNLQGGSLGTFAVSVVFNHFVENFDNPNGLGQGVRAATSVSPFDRLVTTDTVFGVWSLSSTDPDPNPVPTPASIYLFLIGFAALFFRHRPDWVYEVSQSTA